MGRRLARLGRWSRVGIASLGIGGLAGGAACESKDAHVAPAIIAPSASARIVSGPTRRDACDLDGAIAAVRALNGDAIVLKYSLHFEDHDQVAANALRAGAISAEPQIILTTQILQPPDDVEHVVRGLDPRTLDRLASYVVAGTLRDLTGDAIAVGEPLATKLGVTVGQVLTLRTDTSGETARLSDLAEHGRKETVSARYRIVAILRFPEEELTSLGQKVLVTSLRAARALGGMTHENVTGVILRLPATAGDVHAFASRLHSVLTDAFNVVSHDELEGEMVTAIEARRPACTQR